MIENSHDAFLIRLKVRNGALLGGRALVSFPGPWPVHSLLPPDPGLIGLEVVLVITHTLGVGRGGEKSQ